MLIAGDQRGERTRVLQGHPDSSRMSSARTLAQTIEPSLRTYRFSRCAMAGPPASAFGEELAVNCDIVGIGHILKRAAG